MGADLKLVWVQLSQVVLWPEEEVAAVVGLESMKLFLSRASSGTFASWAVLRLLDLFSLSLPSFSAGPAVVLIAEVVFALDQAVTFLETGTCNIGLGRFEGNFANQHILILSVYLSYILSLDVTFCQTPASPLALESERVQADLMKSSEKQRTTKDNIQTK